MCSRSETCACLWFNMRHVSIRPNAQLPLTSSHKCLLCGLSQKFIIVSLHHVRAFTQTGNSISYTFELRHYERGIFSFLICWPFSRSRFYGIWIFDLASKYSCTHPEQILVRSVDGVWWSNLDLARCSVFDCRVRRLLDDVERFDALNTFDVNLISEMTTNRTNELWPNENNSQFITEIDYATVSCDIGFQTYTIRVRSFIRSYGQYGTQCTVPQTRSTFNVHRRSFVTGIADAMFAFEFFCHEYTKVDTLEIHYSALLVA